MNSMWYLDYTLEDVYLTQDDKCLSEKKIKITDADANDKNSYTIKLKANEKKFPNIEYITIRNHFDFDKENGIIYIVKSEIVDVIEKEA